MFLKNRVHELGLKQWWLAEQVGVDRKTVTRWLNGQVRSVQPANIERLCEVLGCGTGDLVLANQADLLATLEDQKAAAKSLIQSSLIDKLGPIGEWDVIENLVKATLVENLPLNVLGELYNQLAIASWRQSKISQAEIYNLKAEEIADRTGDRALLASALLSKANLLSWRGKNSRAIATYRDCLALEKYVEARKIGAVYSNLGAVLYESGDLRDGETFLTKSLEIFTVHGRPTNLSIAHGHLAMIALQNSEIDAAEKNVSESIRCAELDNYRRGQAMGKILQAEILARRNQPQEAKSLLTVGLAEFQALGINEGLNFEYAGRVHRLCGDLDAAETYLRRGVTLAAAFPVYLASVHVELAETLRLKRSATWTEAAEKAVLLYAQCECPLRVDQVKKHFQIR